MPRVHTATKSGRGQDRHCGRCGEKILRFEKYYHWAFRHGGQRFNCYRHPPRPSELTQSKMAAIYAAQELAEDFIGKTEGLEDVAEIVTDVATAVEEVMQEYSDAADAMGAAGEENQNKADELEEWHSELDSWEPPDDDEDHADLLEDARTSAMEIIGSCPL